MVSLIQSKLPRTILAKLEEYKNTDAPWTVTSLRKELKKYISAEEVGDRLVNLYRKGYISVQDRNHDNRQDKKFQHQTKSEHHSTGSFATREMTKRSCYYCGKNHWSDECKQYPDIKSRKKKANGCCFICLKKGHLLKECTSTRPSAYCKKSGNHHRSLYPKQFNQSTELSNATIEETEEPKLVAISEQVIMQTAQVDLVNPTNLESKHETRLLLDSGSQRSYILKELADKMNLKSSHKSFLTIYTFGTTKPKTIETPIVNIGIILKNGFMIHIKTNVIPHVTGLTEQKPIEVKSLRKKIKGYDLADSLPTKAERCRIDLLVGNDYYADIVSMKRITICDGLYLLGSKFGWILSGRAQMEDPDVTENSVMMLTSTSSQLATENLHFKKEDAEMIKKPNLEDFWKLETIGITDTPTVS